MLTRLLDTDVMVDVLRRHPSAVHWFHALAQPPILPGYAVLELFSGCRDQRETRDIENLTGPLSIVWASTSACALISTWYPKQRLSGGMGVLDALIAQMAIEHGATLCTFNTRHFRAVPNLSIEEPYVR